MCTEKIIKGKCLEVYHDGVQFGIVNWLIVAHDSKRCSSIRCA